MRASRRRARPGSGPAESEGSGVPAAPGGGAGRAGTSWRDPAAALPLPARPVAPWRTHPPPTEKPRRTCAAEVRVSGAEEPEQATREREEKEKREANAHGRADPLVAPPCGPNRLDGAAAHLEGLKQHPPAALRVPAWVQSGGDTGGAGDMQGRDLPSSRPNTP